MAIKASMFLNWVSTDNHKVALAVLGIQALILSILYINTLASYSLAGALISIIWMVCVAFKLVTILAMMGCFFKRAWATYKTVLYFFSGFVVGAIVLSILTLNVLRLFEFGPLILEILFCGLSYNYYRIFSKQILP
ncbi:hypothetical protein BCR44DRAFT_1446594 [Catenaria anguillulae PL171]|uniref:Uncharacterized protein n=1 Tax=Catenaria anguillulae PL171 TaxID=765915 RepID=A0A1Y2H626_9FUNG|nr:hypothetical protein BCR44DRAFT_1446594 [Catenaria anguillulae PL171]